MKIFVLEEVGQVKITDLNGKPLSKVYVKCFAKQASGGSKFHKDGYTDLRGTFDYSSLNMESDGGIEKFALLIVSEEYGSVIKEAKPPKGLKKVEGKVLKLKA